jgi:hypothetical protein
MADWHAERKIERIQSGSAGVKTGSPTTTMPNPHLPAELLDNIVDHLHDTEDALRSCCLVSKSWIPRTRRHLFARIDSLPHRAVTWNHGKTRFQILPPLLRVTPHVYPLHSPLDVTPADAEEGGWISTFSRVVHFKVDCCGH